MYRRVRYHVRQDKRTMAQNVITSLKSFRLIVSDVQAQHSSILELLDPSLPSLPMHLGALSENKSA